MSELVKMYRPVGPGEMDLLRENGFRSWPARLPGQPIFYPVTNAQYAEEITRKWNVLDFGIGYVTKFEVQASFAARYPIQQVGAGYHTEWWIPAEDMDELNASLVGIIEVVGEFTTVKDE